MTERSSFDSVDDLERLVAHSPKGFSESKNRPGDSIYEQDGRKRRWSAAKCIALCVGGLLIGYSFGTWSVASPSVTSPWVVGPLGAPYSNCKQLSKGHYDLSDSLL